ncbi:MAG: AraC family transcriptional regulator [Acidimicrobiales bacterium]
MPDRTDNANGPDASLLGRGALEPAMLALLDELVNVMFCAKSTDGRYIAVNPAFVHRSGKVSRRDVIGRRAADLFPPLLAERYEEQDQHIFATGAPLRDELELIRRPDGSHGWYLTTKLAIVDDGEVAGLVSISRDLQAPDDSELVTLSRVVDLVRDRLADSLRVGDLAAAAECSETQLERRMKRVFGLTATQYLLKVRVDRARELLLTTDTPLATIANDVGFYDQASFTRRFARLTGQTPAQFRNNRTS